MVVYKKTAIPNSTKDAYIDAIHATLPGSWEMSDMVMFALWLFIQRDFVFWNRKMQSQGQNS